MGLEVDWRPEGFHLECPCKGCHDVKERFCVLSTHLGGMNESSSMFRFFDCKFIVNGNSKFS